MCGISFYCSKNGDYQAELAESLVRINHRGPDARGTLIKQVNHFNVGLGHNRLAILDLSVNANQPMHFKGMTISYNGEIYNHHDLKQLLIAKGYCFTSQSDTEIILLLYHALGIESFSLLQGMFSLVILDENNKQLLIVRDTMGIKPLYLYQTQDCIVGSSEIRGLTTFPMVKTDVSHQEVFEFFNQGFLYEPDTGYQYIKKLLPGHYLKWNLATNTQQTYPYSTKINLEKDLATQCQKAVEKQTVADVPLGTFFSGGIDSSLIAAYTPNNNLFFVRYENEKEYSYATSIANRLGKTLQITNLGNEKEQMLETVDFVAANTEELISDYTFYPTYQLSQAARNKGYKVMLSGMGGDEVFAGYPRYKILKYHKYLKKIKRPISLIWQFNLFPKKWNKKFERLVSYLNENHWPTAYSRLIGYFSTQDLQCMFINYSDLNQRYQQKLALIYKNFQGNFEDKLKLGQFFDSYGFLPHNLSVSDKASMLASIELRVPLLDESLISRAKKITSNKLIYWGQLKYPLKKLLNPWLSKSEVKRQKVGFNPPLDNLINTLGAEKLISEYRNLTKYIDNKIAFDLVAEHFARKANHSYKLWQLLYFSRWLQLQEIS